MTEDEYKHGARKVVDKFLVEPREKTVYQIVLMNANGAMRQGGETFDNPAIAETKAIELLELDINAVEAFVCRVYSGFKKKFDISRTI